MSQSRNQRRLAARATPARPAPTGDDALRERIAAALLDGAEPDALVHRLVLDGTPQALAGAEIARALASPYFRAATQLQWRLGKWQWTMQNRARLAAQDAAGLSVDILTDPDPDRFHRHHYVGHRPALMKGLADLWPARTKWSLDYLARTLGDTPVRVQYDRESNPDYERQTDAHGADQPFGELATRLASPEPSNDFYITANNSDANRAAFAPLYEDVGEIPALLAPGGARQGFIWIGPKGTITPFHHDLTNNLLMQIVGTKRVRLVASHDTPLMRNDRHCFSRWGDDLTPGPATADRPAVLEVDIEPGDALFIPVGWWHHVVGLSQTIGMSFTAFRWDNDFYSSYASYRAE